MVEKIYILASDVSRLKLVSEPHLESHPVAVKHGLVNDESDQIYIWQNSVAEEGDHILLQRSENLKGVKT